MDEPTRVLVWQKGFVIPGYDPAQWRRDAYGHALSFAAYGDRSSVYGWEMAPVDPVAEGGTDAPGTLRPLHWTANARRH